MLKIKCPWIRCGHNSSTVAGVSGYCQYDGEIELLDFEAKDENDNDIEGLECRTGHDSLYTKEEGE